MACSHNTFGLPYGVWVIDCAPPQAYNVFVIIAPCKRWYWPWGKTTRYRDRETAEA